MSITADTVHGDLPSSRDVRHPRTALLYRARGALAWYAHRRWDLEVRNADRVPASGPVVFVSNHIAFLDGPLMAIVGPRPVHALTKRELFSGALGSFLRASGQIPVDRDEIDPEAVRVALRVLRDGRAVGIFPERTRGAGEMTQAAPGAAYLAMATGATIVPMGFLGTRLPGSAADFPPAGTRFVMSYGSPMAVEQRSWPRRSHDVRALTERIRLAVIDTVAEASQATGMTLPGPLPESDKEQL